MELFEAYNQLSLQGIIEASPYPIAIFHRENLKIALANHLMIDGWGKGNDVVGKSFEKLVPELKDQGVFDELRKVFHTGMPSHNKNRRLNIQKDDKVFSLLFDYSITPLKNTKGKVVAVMKTSADISTYDLIRQEKAEIEEKLNLAIQSAELGTCEADLLSGTFTASPRFNEIWGIEKPTNLRQDIIDRLHPDDRLLRLKAHAMAIADGGKLKYEARVIHPNGKICWVRIKGKMLFNEKRKPAYLIGIIHDITAQKEFTANLERLVNQQTEKLSKSNEDLKQFAHVVSHDLKEPVRKVKMFIDLLRTNQSLEQKDTEFYLKKIDHAADRMVEMIDGILTYSYTDASQQVEKVDLNNIIQNILTDLEIPIREKQVSIHTEQLPDIEARL